MRLRSSASRRHRSSGSAMPGAFRCLGHQRLVDADGFVEIAGAIEDASQEFAGLRQRGVDLERAFERGPGVGVAPQGKGGRARAQVEAGVRGVAGDCLAKRGRGGVELRGLERVPGGSFEHGRARAGLGWRRGGESDEHQPRHASREQEMSQRHWFKSIQSPVATWSQKVNGRGVHHAAPVWWTVPLPYATACRGTRCCTGRGYWPDVSPLCSWRCSTWSGSSPFR